MQFVTSVVSLYPELLMHLNMTLPEFLAYVKTRRALNTAEIHQFMNDMSNEARRITFELNNAYHTPDEVRALLSRLFGKEVDSSFRVFSAFLYRLRKKHHGRKRCVHQRLLPFSGSRRRYLGRRLPDRTQRSVCHPEPRAGSGRPADHLSGTHRFG